MYALTPEDEKRPDKRERVPDGLYKKKYLKVTV